MFVGQAIKRRSSIVAMTVIAATAVPCAADMTWFNEKPGGQPYTSFTALTTAYQSFIGQPENLIDFNSVALGTKLSNEYAASHGVTFSNTSGGQYSSYSGIHKEADGNVEHLTGYDGSYMPHGDQVYLKFSNEFETTPFTFSFDTPVATVGAFVAMGKEGSVHSLSIATFDNSGNLLSRRETESWLWDTTTAQQNYESFFGVKSDSANISRVEIRNLATGNFANALVIDNIAFSRSVGSVPEPGTIALIAMGVAAGARRRRDTR